MEPIFYNPKFSQSRFGLDAIKFLRGFIGLDVHAFQDPENRYKGTPLSEIEIEQFKSTVQEVLKNTECSGFVTAVLEKLTAHKRAFSTNILDVFEEVKKQGGFSRKLNMQDSAVGGSTVGNQNAYITIKLLGVPEGLLNRNFIGRLIIHELFHVASNTTQDYSHFEMYRAGYEVAAARGGFFLGRRPPNRDPGGRDETNGTNFENLIFQVCRSK